MRLQKPHVGLQKSNKFFLPVAPLISTSLPSASVSFTAGATAPILSAAGRARRASAAGFGFSPSPTPTHSARRRRLPTRSCPRVDQHRARRAARAEGPSGGEALIEHHRRREPHRVVRLRRAGRDIHDLRRVRGRVRLARLQIVRHLLAEAAARIPEDQHGLLALEIVKRYGLAGQIGQREGGRRLSRRATEQLAVRRGLLRGSSVRAGWPQPPASGAGLTPVAWANSARIASAPPATGVSILPSADDHRRRRAVAPCTRSRLRGRSGAARGSSRARRPCPCSCRRRPSDDRDRQLRRRFALPFADVGQQRIAGTAAGIGKDEHHRLARGAQRIERRRFAVQAFKLERGRGDPTGSPASGGLISTPRGSAGAALAAAVGQRLSNWSSRSSTRPFWPSR